MPRGSSRHQAVQPSPIAADSSGACTPVMSGTWYSTSAKARSAAASRASPPEYWSIAVVQERRGSYAVSFQV
jgi:hypothetical protein